MKRIGGFVVDSKKKIFSKSRTRTKVTRLDSTRWHPEEDNGKRWICIETFLFFLLLLSLSLSLSLFLSLSLSTELSPFSLSLSHFLTLLVNLIHL